MEVAARVLAHLHVPCNAERDVIVLIGTRIVVFPYDYGYVLPVGCACRVCPVCGSGERDRCRVGVDVGLGDRAIYPIAAGLTAFSRATVLID